MIKLKSLLITTGGSLLAVLIFLRLLQGSAVGKPVFAAPLSGPVSGIPLVCRDIVDVRDPDLAAVIPHPTGAVLEYWFLQRGVKADHSDAVPLLYGTTNNLYYRDRGLTPQTTYYYLLDTYWQTSNGGFLQPVIYQPVLINDSCSGHIYEDLTITPADYLLGSLYLLEDAVLIVEEGAQLRPIESSWGHIENQGAAAELIIEGGDFFSTTIHYKNGIGSINHARFSPGNVTISTTGDIPVANSQFTGGEIAVNAGRATLRGNSGTVNLNLGQRTQVVAEHNIITGEIHLLNHAEGFFLNNDLTGRLVAGDHSLALLLSNRISGTHPAAYTLAAWDHSHIVALGPNSRVETHLCDPHPASCRLAWILNESEITLRETSVKGAILADDSSRLSLTDSPSIRGQMTLNGDSRAELLRNHLASYIYLNARSNLQALDNVIGTGQLYLRGDASGAIQRNTFTDGVSGYAIEADGGRPHPHPDLMIKDNCVQSFYGLRVGANRTTTLTVEGNWWGHSTGPYHAQLHPLGQGARILGMPVDFTPYLDVPTFCRQNPPPPPPPVPGSASGIFDARGGYLFVPDGSARLTFPPQAVSQTTRVTITQSVGSRQGSRLSTGTEENDLVILRSIEVNAVLSGTAVPVTHFAQPITLTVFYAAGEIAGVSEYDLGLYTQGNQGWVPLAGPPVDRHLNRLDGQMPAAGMVALAGRPSRLFLPLIMSQPTGLDRIGDPATNPRVGK